MSLYKRGAVWHYDFTIGDNRYRGSTRQRNEHRAGIVESRLMARVSGGDDLIPQKSPRLIDFADRFFIWLKAVQSAEHISAKTLRYYSVGWEHLKSTGLIYMTLSKIDNSVLQSTPLRGGPANRNQAIRTLRRMLGKAEGWKLIHKAPRLRLYPEHGREAIIDKDTEAKLLPHMGPTLRDVYFICNDGGCRPDEVFRARIENVDWQKRTLHIERGKSKKARRVVPLSARAFDALFARVKDKKEGWLFPSKRAKCGHLTTVAKMFRRARGKAGLPKCVVLYSARHSFGTFIYEQTGNLKLIMDLMGHSDVRTAMRYQHPEIEVARGLIDQRNGEQDKTARVM